MNVVPSKNPAVAQALDALRFIGQCVAHDWAAWGEYDFVDQAVYMHLRKQGPFCDDCNPITTLAGGLGPLDTETNGLLG